MGFSNVVAVAALVLTYSGTCLARPDVTCPKKPTSFELSDPPYTNYFYSDCHTAAQVVVTSPLPGNDLTFIGPRLLVAWPAGNSGAVAFFAPKNGVNGSLAISLTKPSAGNVLEPIYIPSRKGKQPPVAGVSGLVSLNSSATLTQSLLGSIRTMRDFIEGPSILIPMIQDAIVFSKSAHGGVSIARQWLDNKTTTTLEFTPVGGKGGLKIKDRTVDFKAGTYKFKASFNYPQLQQLSPEEVLNKESHDLITKSPDQVQSLSFLSYTGKLLAGAWRFLTYFGRDSVISMLLLENILSAGPNSSFEAGIASLLERLNKTDGTAAHEETIGDYSTFLNLQKGIQSAAPQYDYKMIDTDFFVPIVLAEYFLKNTAGKARAKEFLSQKATVNPENSDLTYGQLATLNAAKIMKLTAAFAAEGGQVRKNLIHLKEGEIVGEWRDSTYGLGGGRIPYNVNTAIAPAGLGAIAALAEAGFFPDHPDWVGKAAKYAKVWEDKTLEFFEVTIPQDEARSLVDDYVKDNKFPFPSQTNTIKGDVTFHGVALDGNNGQSLVRVMNTDDCFRHFLLNTTNQEQLTAFISQTADNILAPFPVGLSSDVGLLVANPAYGNDPVYSANFTNAFYHGTVVWSWQLAMMAKGLERQIGRCSNSDSAPDFCGDMTLRGKVIMAYNRLWDLIEANEPILSGEVWSWRYDNNKFVPLPLGALNPTESNIRQLWSLSFLAVKRNKGLS